MKHKKGGEGEIYQQISNSPSTFCFSISQSILETRITCPNSEALSLLGELMLRYSDRIKREISHKKYMLAKRSPRSKIKNKNRCRKMAHHSIDYKHIPYFQECHQIGHFIIKKKRKGKCHPTVKLLQSIFQLSCK